jgi:hypothetical protein
MSWQYFKTERRLMTRNARASKAFTLPHGASITTFSVRTGLPEKTTRRVGRMRRLALGRCVQGTDSLESVRNQQHLQQIGAHAFSAQQMVRYSLCTCLHYALPQ